MIPLHDAESTERNQMPAFTMAPAKLTMRHTLNYSSCQLPLLYKVASSSRRQKHFWQVNMLSWLVRCWILGVAVTMSPVGIPGNTLQMQNHVFSDHLTPMHLRSFSQSENLPRVHTCISLCPWLRDSYWPKSYGTGQNSVSSAHEMAWNVWKPEYQAAWKAPKVFSCVEQLQPQVAGWQVSQTRVKYLASHSVLGCSISGPVCTQKTGFSPSSYFSGCWLSALITCFSKFLVLRWEEEIRVKKCIAK